VKHKFITAILLFNLVAWANSAAFCLSGLSAMASHVAAVVGISPPHSCCPHPTTKLPAKDWTQSQSSDNGHRCCFVQNPQIPSNLPGRSQNSDRHVGIISASYMTNSPTADFGVPAILRVDGFHQASRFGTVLRI
jgi:hypothetical protein